jgi:hypothetical protein
MAARPTESVFSSRFDLLDAISSIAPGNGRPRESTTEMLTRTWFRR